jgi:diguanylate cyclase (GGDEF)-like protein/PAS domain S-box-containing protein
VVESLGKGLVITDIEDRMLYANSRMKQLTGYETSELVGQIAHRLLFPEEEWAKGREELERRAAGVASSYEVQHRRKDGQIVWLELNAVPHRDKDGCITGTLALIEDIGERKRAEHALRASEERYRLMVEGSEQVFFYIHDKEHRFEYLSPSVAAVLGYAPEELIGRPYDDLLMGSPSDERVHELTDTAIEAIDGFSTYQAVVGHKDGRAVVLELVETAMSADGRVLGIQGFARDITERQRAEDENLRLASLSRENPNAVLECDAEGKVMHINPAASNIARELGVESIAGLLPRNHSQLVASSLEGDQPFHSVEAAAGNRIFSWSYRPFRDAGVVYLFAVDITGRRQMEEQLRHDALHDALTGLPNRLLFMERLAHAILRSKRRAHFQFAVLFLDLDRFKVINDSLGHHVGDDLLVLVAKRLQSCLREEDTVARLGGDEFAILLEDIQGVEDATRIADRIQRELTTPVSLSGFEVFTSASIGIALSSTAYERPEYLLRNADMAMYRAKAAGQSRFEVFDRAMHAHALTRLQLENDLRRALERQEFQLHYQPIISLRTGEMIAVEALIRWAHPDRGLMMPDAFIPVAEETGVILPIGEWVLQQACRHASEWRERFDRAQPLCVSVNLSAKQFSQTDLIKRIAGALEASGLPGSALRLEITESAIMENAETATVLLERMKELGVQISLDDFGTGYSSLSYLHRFPLDTLKIDRSFVMRMHDDNRSAQLVQTIHGLARSLGASAVAEGVELDDQLRELRRIDCDFGQGFLFSPPLPADDLEELLREGRKW